MSNTTSPLRVGFVGAAGRGGSFRAAFDVLGAQIAAVCDLDPARLEEARVASGAEAGYTDYATMLEEARLDAVVIGTPMALHVPQALQALARDIHVLSEVPAGVSMEECRQPSMHLS